MDETEDWMAEENADLKSTREVLQKWNEYYESKNFGLGVQCDKCKKWRVVFEYQDESEVPKTWICSMWKMDDGQRGSCRIPSDKTEADFTESLYSPGSMVWAKVYGYPWWPGMIEDCPDERDYFAANKKSEHEYHVNFFGKPQRGWIKASHIKDFSTRPPTSPKAKRDKDLPWAIEQANEALKMTPKERLKNFSFSVRYEGKWAKVKELDETDLPPNCLKMKKREKATDFKSQAITEETHGNQDHLRSSTVRKARNVKSKTEAATKRRSADKEKLQPTVRKARNVKSEAATKRKSADKEKLQPTVRKARNVKSKSEAATKRRSVGKKKLQPTVSQKEKIKKNNSSRNRFADLSKDGTKEKRESSRNCIKQLFKSKTRKDNKDEEDSPVHIDAIISSEDEDVSADNKEFQPLLSHKKKIKENNHSKNHLVVLYQDGAKEKQETPEKCAQKLVEPETNGHKQGEDSPLHIDITLSSDYGDTAANDEEFQPSARRKEEMDANNHSMNHVIALCEAEAKEKHELPGKSVQELDGVETKGYNRGEDSPVHNDATMSSVSENEDMHSPKATSYLEHIDQVCSSKMCDTDNDVSNGNSDSAILREHVENFSERELNINDSNSAEFSQNNRVINHVNDADLSENDSDIYILDTDPSLLRTPCPPRFTLESEQISKRCERFKRNRVLSDELVNSNTSRYMPYSFYRRRM